MIEMLVYTLFAAFILLVILLVVIAIGSLFM